ncbi:MAG: dTMP kinase [bacterium]
MAGFFVMIEGIDGSGKSVLAQAIAQKLKAQNREVLLTKEPGGSDLGKHLRAMLQKQPVPISGKTEFLLFAADRAHHYETIIKPALERGAIVISDRGPDSSLAYQSYGRGVDKDMIERVNQWATLNINPDIILYVRVDIDVACKRFADRGKVLTTFEKEQKDFWQRVSQGYETMYAGRTDVAFIDGNQNKQAVLDSALACHPTWG